MEQIDANTFNLLQYDEEQKPQLERNEQSWKSIERQVLNVMKANKPLSLQKEQSVPQYSLFLHRSPKRLPPQKNKAILKLKLQQHKQNQEHLKQPKIVFKENDPHQVQFIKPLLIETRIIQAQMCCLPQINKLKNSKQRKHQIRNSLGKIRTVKTDSNRRQKEDKVINLTVHNCMKEDKQMQNWKKHKVKSLTDYVRKTIIQNQVISAWAKRNISISKSLQHCKRQKPKKLLVIKSLNNNYELKIKKLSIQ